MPKVLSSTRTGVPQFQLIVKILLLSFLAIAITFFQSAYTNQVDNISKEIQKQQSIYQTLDEECQFLIQQSSNDYLKKQHVTISAAAYQLRKYVLMNYRSLSQLNIFESLPKSKLSRSERFNMIQDQFKQNTPKEKLDDESLPPSPSFLLLQKSRCFFQLCSESPYNTTNEFLISQMGRSISQLQSYQASSFFVFVKSLSVFLETITTSKTINTPHLLQSFGESLVSDILNASKNKSVDFTSPQLEELKHLRQFGVPLRKAVSSLVKIWEKTWKDIGLLGSSHKQISQRQVRRDNSTAFQEVQKRNNSQFLPQALADSPKEHAFTSNNPPKNAFESNHDNNQTQIMSNSTERHTRHLNTSSDIKINTTHHRATDQVQRAEKDFPLVRNNTESLNNSRSSTSQQRPSEISSEEELIPLRQQIKYLWRSKEWRDMFNLSSNNFYQAKKKIPASK